ncbi:DNA recombination protein RmuC [Flavitalea sp. BT771]|uniref:DNA recombination protein RmuC n=1 Tax=Flavitalea sp. BT771 TaxID=3063329 RepID=UPI0026E3C380|nr:DNA recombination protein RmuC [Flavitalea sp. BT771]MDO6432993.1 DNA recombination protein RmuC [Flavitalea sp. BT771]MDV6221731.1 DNA recombination protein RmuC [Flavitalea sp. BT771]
MPTIFYLLIGLVAGSALGYLLARLAIQASLLRLTAEVNSRLTREEVAAGYVALESFRFVQEKLALAEAKLTSQEQELSGLTNQLTVLEQNEKHLQEKITGFKDELQSMHDLSHEQFRNIAAKILEDRQTAFVATNKKELNDILTPFKDGLSEFRKKVEDTRKEDIADLTSLKKEIESLEKLNSQLSEDARNLATALKSEVKIQGNWGEDRLNMILEAEGLQQYIDFTREEQYVDEDKDRVRRPDYILRLPNGKHIIIDSKVSLTAYSNYFNADTPEQKAGFLKQHVKSISDHIRSLADKNYQSLAGLHTPDYIFMFMPIESALTLAMNQNGELFTQALNRKIVLITPTTLVATLKVVRLLWQKENQVKNVEEIFKQCGALYDKFVDFIGDMDRIEEALNGAGAAYRDAMYKLQSGERKGYTIMGRMEAIRRLEARVSKVIPAKHLTDLDTPEEEDNSTYGKTDHSTDGPVAGSIAGTDTNAPH